MYIEFDTTQFWTRERERERVFSTIAYRNEIQILATFRNAASCFLGTASSY